MKPMLAKPYAARYIKSPGYLQPKLDGIRMIWTGDKALSRTGKEIVSVPFIIEHLKRNYSDFPLDGELYSHGRSFQSFLGSVRKTVNIEEDVTVLYHVYDTPIADKTFEERHLLLKNRVLETNRLKVVETVRLDENDTSLESLQRYERQGYEGSIYRTASGLYKFGKRSADLVKIKTFEDAEFECYGVMTEFTYDKVIVPEGTPGSKPYSDGRYYRDENPIPKDRAGKLLCRTKDGLEFEVGSGLSEEERNKLWENPPIGKMITVKYFGFTDGNKPRHPVFVAVRDYE